MPIRVNGGVFDDQMMTGSLRHFVCEGASFNGAVDQHGQPVPGSAAEIIFTNIAEDGFIDIMNPNSHNLSFALEINRSRWDGPSLTAMVQSLGNDVGVDHVDCSVCEVFEVPYIWNLGSGPTTSFLDLTDTPATYAGSAGYAVTVNPGQTGLIFTPAPSTNAFSSVIVATEPTINAVGSTALTFVAGSNITLATNALSKTVTINSTVTTNDYIPVPPSTMLQFSNKYFVTSAGTVTLPLANGSGEPAGTSVTITKPTTVTVIIDRADVSDTIATDLGDTDSIEFDATQELVFVFDGTATWNLQLGSAL